MKEEKLGIYINDAGPVGRGEIQAVLHQPGDRSIVIHPWIRRRFGNYPDSSVFVAIGALKKSGNEKYDEDDDRYDYINAIFDREDFVESVLAVFPELQRVDK